MMTSCRRLSDTPGAETADLRRDPIGNRTDYIKGDPNSGGDSFLYVSNSLNQYERVNGGAAGLGFKYDEDGNLTHMYAAADVNQDGVIDVSDLGLVQVALQQCVGDSGYDPDADIDGSGCVDVSDLAYVIALYGTPSNAVELTWDAENRLVGWTPIAPTSEDVKVEFRYDYMGRRVEKKVYPWDPAGGGGAGAWETAPDVWKRWTYYDWLPIVEFDVVASGGAISTGDGTMNVSKKYTWGLDLAGLSGSLNSIKEAGGIGGLIASRDEARGWGAGRECKFDNCWGARFPV